MKIVISSLERWFRWKMSLQRVERACARLEMKKSDQAVELAGLASQDGRMAQVQVSCVQREIRPVRRIEEFVELLHGYVRDGAESGSLLVVFPEYNFLDLVGLIAGFRVVNYLLRRKVERDRRQGFTVSDGTESGWEGGVERGGEKSFDVALTSEIRCGLDEEKSDMCGRVEGGCDKYSREEKKVDKYKRDKGRDEDEEDGGITPMDLFRVIAGPLQQVMEMVFSTLARGYGIYIYTGSYVVKDNDVVFNVGSLFGPDGEKVGTQRKLHLTHLESSFGMGQGDRLEMYDLPIGKVVFPVCMDATYFETFQIANKMGAEIVIMPIANPEEYNVWKSLKGIWPRVQEAHVFGLKAALTGWLAGMHYTGKAGVFAPLDLTPGRDGVLALSRHCEGDELVSAVLDFEALRVEREQAEYFGDHNPEFERDFVERTYRSR